MAQIDCVYKFAQPVTWEKNGTSILEDKDGKLTHFYNGTLQFNSVTEKEEGIYTCVVEVGFGKTARCPGELRLTGGFTRTNYSVKITP